MEYASSQLHGATVREVVAAFNAGQLPRLEIPETDRVSIETWAGVYDVDAIVSQLQKPGREGRAGQARRHH